MTVEIWLGNVAIEFVIAAIVSKQGDSGKVYYGIGTLIEFGALGIGGGGGKEREKAKYFSHDLYLTNDVMITDTEKAT